MYYIYIYITINDDCHKFGRRDLPPFRLGPAEKRRGLRGRQQSGLRCAQSRRHGGFVGRLPAGRQQKLGQGLQGSGKLGTWWERIMNEYSN